MSRLPISCLGSHFRVSNDSWFSASDEFVTFFIGKKGEEKKFLVHKSFVCHYSPVLRAAFNSTMIEGQTQTYRFEDTTEEVFSFLVEWLYAQKIVLPPSNEYSSISLVKLWVLAEKLLMPGLQNCAIDLLHQRRIDTGRIATKTIQWVYDNTMFGCPLRKMFLDQCANKLIDTYVLDYPEEFPKDMLIELVVVLRGIVTDAKVAKVLDPANYYVKEEDN